MIYSMTGFASRNVTVDGIELSIEIKSYNHRFLDVSVKSPKFLAQIENIMKKEISRYIDRGKVDVYVNVIGHPVSNMINKERLKDIYRIISLMKKELGIRSETSMQDIFQFRDFFVNSAERFSPNPGFNERFTRQFSVLLRDFVNSRKKEGESLRKELFERLRKIELLLKKVEKLLPEIKKRQKQRIHDKITDIFKRDVNRERLEQEIAYMIDKMDVTEEVVRLKTHLSNFRKIIDEREPSGKKLDFYTQEMVREINTLSVKSQDATVSDSAVEMKAEVEKIREQVQNVE